MVFGVVWETRLATLARKVVFRSDRTNLILTDRKSNLKYYQNPF